MLFGVSVAQEKKPWQQSIREAAQNRTA